MRTPGSIESLVPAQGRSYDVVVAGGGMAGLGAAMAAAQNKARTLLLEAESYFGGVAAVTFWMPINRLLLDGGPRGGVVDLFVDAIRHQGPEAYTDGKEDSICGDGLDVHPDYLKLAIFEALETAGVHYRLYSPVTDVLLDGDAVTGVVVSGKSGRQTFHAKVVVDATGDGDVACLAGAEVMEGREEDGRHMPVSLTFALAHVDVDRFLAFLENERTAFEQAISEARDRGYCTAEWYDFDRTTVPGVLSVNNGGAADMGNVDGTDPRHLTIAERMGIQVAVDFVRLAREARLPGLEACYLIGTGARVGVRDTRRVVGEYVFTVDDARTGPQFPDVVARKYGAIDACQIFIGEMESGHGYPYRCLLPKGVDNLLVAGRCGSATFLGLAAGKSMGNMMEVGQAAGVAAALCSAQDLTPRDIDVAQVQDVLRSMGVKL